MLVDNAAIGAFKPLNGLTAGTLYVPTVEHGVPVFSEQPPSPVIFPVTVNPPPVKLTEPVVLLFEAIPHAEAFTFALPPKLIGSLKLKTHGLFKSPTSAVACAPMVIGDGTSKTARYAGCVCWTVALTQLAVPSGHGVGPTTVTFCAVPAGRLVAQALPG